MNRYNNSITPMLQKHPLIKLSTQRLEPLALDPLEHCLNPSHELVRTIRTPRCSTFQKESQDIHRTQKLEVAHKANLNRERLPSIRKGPQDLKENLLDLDLYFEMEPPCQNGQLSDRLPFVIRKLRLPSASSKGKQTTTGSHDSSLDSQKEGSTIKNATPSIEKKQALGRGRSEGKHVMTCRIVNSKKLPFQLRPQNIKRYRQGLEEMTVDISAILKKESSEPFMSKDSLQNLCLYL